ncbi:nucleoside hydrolase-like [Cochliomyia hominivorax]
MSFIDGYVIFDCDIGMDDAWGLLSLIKCEKYFQNLKGKSKITNFKEKLPETFKILAITCVHGNTDVHNAAKNALRILDSVDRLDIPVYKGCNKSILPSEWDRSKFFYGADGFGDLKKIPEVTQQQPQKEHAVNIMYSLVCEHPNMIDFILLGPLTNFALCINLYGEEFLNKVRNIYIMGGNYKGKGNLTKSAEFNFMLDPEAANIVFENVKEQNIHILPWETCVDGEMHLTVDWRFNVMGRVNTKAVQLMNTVEGALYKLKPYPRWIICDAILVMAYCFRKLKISKLRRYYATVELIGIHTRGQMVLDHKHKDQGNTHIILDVNKEMFKQVISWVGGLINDDEMDKWLMEKIEEN